MGRTFTNTAQISKGFEMYAKGYRRSRILDSFGDQPRPSLRTLGNWIARYKNISEDMLALEHEFEWLHMDIFSIPWEYAHLINRLSSLELQKPSLRRVRWWFRIKKINPHYSDGIVAYIANKCVVNEHMDLMEIPGSDWSSLLESMMKRSLNCCQAHLQFAFLNLVRFYRIGFKMEFFFQLSGQNQEYRWSARTS